jgi:hypothetical protein
MSHKKIVIHKKIKAKPGQVPGLGPTHTFPGGKLTTDDEGELIFGLAADVPNRLVRVDFGGPVRWLALPPEMARELAKVLIEKAELCEKGTP